MYSCPICKKEFKNKTGLSCHSEKRCSLFLKRLQTNHICPKCGQYISNHINQHVTSCQKSNKCGTGKNWANGKTYDQIYGEKAVSIKNQISKSLIGKCSGLGKDDKTELVRIEKIRTKINERYANGWQVKCGRCLKIDYKSPTAGKIKVDGSWELAVAKYLDSILVKWIRNTERFEYFNSIKNKKSTYCPDFFVFDWNSFIEVKGYTTDLDKIKWQQFPHILEIWDKHKIKSLGIDIR